MSFSRVAEWSSGVTWERVPEHVVRWSRDALVDTIAVMLAGLDAPTSLATMRTAARSPGTATLIGSDRTTTPALAALVMASAANALDFDDGHFRGGGIHAGSATFGALLALAADDVTLPQLRLAAIVGYEVAVRTGFLVSSQNTGLSSHASGYAAAVGAAAAGARLLALDAATTASALRIAAAQAPVSDLTAPGARESIGWAAATAVTSVLLAIDGLSPSTSGDEVAAPFTRDPLRDGGDWIDTLGQVFECSNCYTKPYPTCRVIHSALDGLVDLMAAHDLDNAQISHVDVFTSEWASRLDVVRPHTLEEAQFSFPFAIGVMATRGHLTALDMDESSLGDADALEFARRVRVTFDPSIHEVTDGEYPARVEIEAGGRTHSSLVAAAGGSLSKPLSDEQRLEKVASCLSRFSPGLSSSEFIAVCHSDSARVGDLRTLLAPATRASRREYRPHA